MPNPAARLLGAQLGDVTPCDEPDGWPEFDITLRFYVTSDNPTVIERQRQQLWRALSDAAIEATHDPYGDLTA